MHLPPYLPEIAFVRVQTPGGPYRVGDMISVAFTTAAVGRLARHKPGQLDAGPVAGEHLVPESVTVEVTVGAGSFCIGDYLTLSFVDPRIARIHPCDTRDIIGRPASESTSADGVPEPTDDATAAHEISAEASCIREAAEHSALQQTVSAVTFKVADSAEGEQVNTARRMHNDRSIVGVRVVLAWDRGRARRFVYVADKLLAVDRLGWYRHVLAVRMLVPDSIVTGDPSADVKSCRALGELRSAVAQSLGRPLLAACMPNFSVTPEWLDELDGVAASRAAAALREAIAPYVADNAVIAEDELTPRSTLGIVTRSDLLAAPNSSVELLLPILIPCLSPRSVVTQTLNNYRCTLVDAFGQTAGSVQAVRLGAMSQPNLALDDRLWQLVGAIGESFGDLVTA